MDNDRVPDTPPARHITKKYPNFPVVSADDPILIPDSDDYIYDDDGHETVATVPVHAPTQLQTQTQTQLQTQSLIPTQPLSKGGLTQPTQPLFTTTSTQQQGLTQPTQIIERPTNHPAPTRAAAGTAATTPSKPSPAAVQVVSSSPLGPTERKDNNSSNTYTARPGTRPGILARAMAPPGTAFRPPQQQTILKPGGNKYPAEDDDGPKYRGGASSSDEDDIQRGGDIKPSTFRRASDKEKDKETAAESPVAAKTGKDAFRAITAAAFYKGDGGAEKRKADGSLSTAGGQEPASKKPRNGNEGASTTQRDYTSYLLTIPDFQVRLKVARMLPVLPKTSPEACHEALMAHKGNQERALAYLARLEDQDEKKEQPSSEDELSLDQKTSIAQLRTPSQPPAKQQIKARSRIQDKWTASQRAANAQADDDGGHSVPAAPKRRLIRGQKSRQPSPETSSDQPKKKPGGRLIRGRKNRSPSRSESPVLEVIDPDSSDADAEVQSDDDHTLEDRVLSFFNDCSADDLADIAEISSDQAKVLVEQRPFSSLAAVRAVTNDTGTSAETKANGKSRKLPRKTFGDKVVEKCLDMWTGYEAVDSLVTQCEELGRPVAEEMKKWGVDVFGCKTQGELECVSLTQQQKPPHDSGIGTPTSNRSSSEEINGRNKAASSSFVPQPSIMAESVTLKDFQIVGLNWLSLLFEQNLSCILADEMGLGKTCQVISFLAHLFEKDVTGPHLVVVPSSTLENWLREFSVFCPKLQVMPYYADQATRAKIREDIERNRSNINVVITTYTIAKMKIDSAFLRSMDFTACVYDEGHMLKSSKSQLYDKLIRIPAQFRLLLTGTPLQNNLQELASLLGFILPSVFKERKEDLESIFRSKAKTVDDTHAALLSAQRIARAKSMLTPFVLRRKKHQVIDLPPKVTRVEYCKMNDTQREIYQEQVDEVKQLIADRAAGKANSNKSANILMKLRQAAIHPLFYRRLYDNGTLRRMAKACVKYEQWSQSSPDVIFSELCAYNDFECHSLCVANPGDLSRFQLKNDEWMDSGKVTELAELLKKFTAQGDRTLVFSQFTMVMDILENVLETLRLRFYRIDGRTSVEDRQPTLDAFHEQTDVPVFLLSTKAGGAGINLACANKVIIFDSSFNPQEDVQAENRAHRVGQTREVEVVRLVTRDTVEEQIHALGQTKLALDQRVAGEEDGASSKKKEEEGLKAVEGMVIAGLEQEDNNNNNNSTNG